jgi:hypothetical protein
MTLRPCGSCGRHVRVSENACPFCRASIDPTPTPPSARVVGRLGRAAIFAFGAAATTVAVASSEGCSTTTTPPDAADVVDTGGPMPLYGGAPDTGPENDDAGISPPYGTPSEDAGTDAGLAAMYGAPPQDAGVDAADPIAPAYGGPPDPPDAGADGGGVAPLYGGSPGS